MNDPLKEVIDELSDLKRKVKSLQVENAEKEKRIKELESMIKKNGLNDNYIGDLNELMDKVADQDKTIEELREALEDLVSAQNGPPLFKFEQDWNEAMKKVYKVLGWDKSPDNEQK